MRLAAMMLRALDVKKVMRRVPDTDLDAGTKDKRSGYLPEMTFTSNDRDRFSQSRARSRTGLDMPAFIQRTDCGNLFGRP